MDLVSSRPPSREPLGSHRVELSPGAGAWVETAEVRRERAFMALRLRGRIEAAEPGVETVTSWTTGWVDDLKVDEAGAVVERGQLLAALYAPELYEPHEELLRARAFLRSAMQGGREAQSRSAEGTVESTRDWLARHGVPRYEITRLERMSGPTRTFFVRSRVDAVVLERLVSRGDHVRAGQPMYRVADLSTVWVQLEAYEEDLAYLTVGQAVQIEVIGLEGEVFEGTVGRVAPTVDSHRRTAEVRVELPNPGRRLAPGMYARGLVRAPASAGAEVLVVPASAPLFTGRRSVVYVELSDGAYEARTVQLGRRAGAAYPVQSGLHEGDRVVVRGAFALDADLQIQGGRSMMVRAAEATAGPSSRSSPQPSGAASQPSRAASQPANASSQPAPAVAPNPHASSRPAGASSQPWRASTQPSRASSRPAGASSQPSRASTQPSHAASRPAGAASQPSRASSRPSGASSRPAVEGGTP